METDVRTFMKTFMCKDQQNFFTNIKDTTNETEVKNVVFFNTSEAFSTFHNTLKTVQWGIFYYQTYNLLSMSAKYRFMLMNL